MGSNQLFVKDTTIKDCGSGVQTTSTRATFDNCRLEGNGTGWLAGIGSKATIRRSVAAANGQALAAGGSGTELNIDDCTVSNNGDGIRSDSVGNIVRVANTTVTGNNVGLLSFGGALLSRTPATNTVEGNTTNGDLHRHVRGKVTSQLRYPMDATTQRKQSRPIRGYSIQSRSSLREMFERHASR